jgi:hypothetical protein
MGILPEHKIFWCFLLLCAAACVLQPVMAENGTITIAYRGSGGGYIGDTIVFDGRNTFGNMTLLKINGPGLPSDGVPVNNLNGPSGTATSVGVDQYGMWKFVWYASTIPGLERLQTARYTITAMDSENPEQSTTTSVMLKKPEFYITVSPNPSNPGDYVELIGTAEQGITSVKIEVTDASGRVLHVFTSPVGSSGYLSYGFHGDMEPGQYTVTVSNPSIKAPYKTVLSVVAPEETLPVTTVMTPEPGSAIPTAEVTGVVTPAPASETSPTKSPVAPLTILAALMAGVIIAGISRRS